MLTQTISGKISDYVIGLKYEDIPDDVIDHVKMLILDTFGVILPATKEEHADCVLRTVTKLHSEKEATLWGTNQKTSVDNAAIYNGCLIHGQDYDDTHAGAILHPSASVLNTAMVIGENLHIDGKEILTSMVAGYEVLVRLGESCKGLMHKHYFHPSGVFAPFAAICIAGRLQHVSKEVMVNALGIAGSFAGSIMQFTIDGTWNKKLHPGWGVHAGLYALRFAQEGYLGCPEVFEGSQALFVSHTGTAEYVEEGFADLGSRWATKEITFKFYPICHMMHSHIDILLSFMKEYHFTADDIESMEAVVYPRGADTLVYPLESKKHPLSTFNMRFSLFYNLAQAAIHGGLPMSVYDMKCLDEPAVLDLIERVSYRVDPDSDVPGHFPGELSVTLKDGRTFSHLQKFEVGAKENPAKKEHVLNKYYTNTEGFISKSSADELLHVVEDFENIADVGEIIKLIQLQ